MIIKNLLLVYNKHLCVGYYPTFKVHINTGTQIEDVINNGMLKNEESCATGAKEVSAVNSHTSLTKPQRNFDELQANVKHIFEIFFAFYSFSPNSNNSKRKSKNKF
jgi:hypothetical protein